MSSIPFLLSFVPSWKNYVPWVAPTIRKCVMANKQPLKLRENFGFYITQILITHAANVHISNFLLNIYFQTQTYSIPLMSLKS